MEKEDITIWFEAGNADILGVWKNEHIDILTRGWDNTINDGFDCIIRIEKDLYFEELNKWLNGKSRYCDRYKYYCGVMGNVTSLGPELIETINMDGYADIDGEINIYRVEQFEGEPDFERG